jgi:multiple sugar transport system permease protein
MAQQTRTIRVLKSVASHAALMTLSAVFLLPFAWLVSTSVKSETHMSTTSPEFIPRAEYVEIEPGRWAEVVRNEILKYAPIEHDAEGRALPRKGLISKVKLVDRFGNPIKELLFKVDAEGLPALLDTGTIPEPLAAAFAGHQVPLSDKVAVLPQTGQDAWSLADADKSYLAIRGGHSLAVYRDLSSQVVDSAKITTRSWPTFRHYAQGIKAFRFDLFLQNTLFIATIAVVGTVLSSSWVAFGFAILEWPGRNKIFYLMLATMMLPPQVTMIPLFLIFKNLGWINTYRPLLVPAFMGNAFFIFLLRQFFLTIPKDLIDAARVDGCSTFRIYWQIVLPLSIPALATVALFTFMASWNDFMGPLIYVVDEAKYTLSLGLAMFKGRFATRYGEMMAVSVLLTLPIIVLFFFTQKTFIQGIKTSGMKG